MIILENENKKRDKTMCKQDKTKQVQGDKTSTRRQDTHNGNHSRLNNNK
jgi:hypothetical protein